MFLEVSLPECEKRGGTVVRDLLILAECDVLFRYFLPSGRKEYE
jgi:hypothetical protein